MIPDKCSHGVTWENHCRECEYIADLETVRLFAPIVCAAECRIHQYAMRLTEQPPQDRSREMSDNKCICGRTLAFDGKHEYCPDCDDKEDEDDGTLMEDDTWDDYE